MFNHFFNFFSSSKSATILYLCLFTKNKGYVKECLWWYISICYTNMIFKKYKNWKITTIVNILNIISKSKSYAAIVTVVYDIRYADNTRIARNDSYSVNANNWIYSINENRMRCLIIHFVCNLSQVVFFFLGCFEVYRFVGFFCLWCRSTCMLIAFSVGAVWN